MRIISSWGLRLLSAYLILVGLLALVPALNVIPPIVVSLIALAAGILILVGR